MAYLAARLPVLALSCGSVAEFAAAVNRYRVAIGVDEVPVDVRPDRIAASFTGDRVMRIDGRPISGFAELSGFFEAADGWVRAHANYPHHRARLLRCLDLPDGTDRARLAERTAALGADDIEARAVDAGAIAARVRTEAEWSASGPGLAAAAGPLVVSETRADVGAARAGSPSSSRPLTGVRVLDMTRVIAGPTATRALALAGAEVLRVDPPQLPEIDWQHVESGQGKHTTLLDLREAADREVCRTLLRSADVLVTGYRPGSLERFGLAPSDTRPGLVWARVSAWGETGPWAGRRGFDSIVQAASGIALVESAEPPGALPAQALDHATGYHLAAGVVDALTQRLADARGRTIRAALARTAAELLAAPGRVARPESSKAPGSDTLVEHGGIRTARPALASYDDFPFPSRPWGADPPAWQV